MTSRNAETWRLAATLAYTMMLALLFAQVEIHIEGDAGWAANLPTWRIEDHWMLDVFWGGRPLTGYHATMFSFIGLAFHLPAFFKPRWGWPDEARVLGCLMVFWIVEDFLWFVTNPGYGIGRFTEEHIAWHKHWFLFAPVDYWVFGMIALALLVYSMRSRAA
ncbi:MAG TPA: hypothetical protein VM406_03475 [Noviherbaspirillum sp.]|nr:hypothetical protein [Noviherbaspirillum sp.]